MNAVNITYENLNAIEQSFPVVVNWKQINAVTLERTWNDERETFRTIIGYYDRTVNSEIKEWYLWCSDEQHERLVTEFRIHLGK